MSLSFVSKAVLTAKEGGDGYEEKPIAAKTGDASGSASSYTTSRPLFEQLRANKEQEELEREEFQKSIMRGTLALDEEDCAHLDAIEKKGQAQRRAIQQQTQTELQAFRAAQAVNRLEQGFEEIEEDQQEEEDKWPAAITNKTNNSTSTTSSKSKKQLFPKITKKRKRTPINSDVGYGEPNDEQRKQQQKEEIVQIETQQVTKKSAPLVNLLAGYGSDSNSN